MWASSSNVKQDSIWGNYVSDVDTEAAIIMANEPYAALLDSIGLIKITGDDAESFLQGQLTCDFNTITAGHAQLGAHCNVKGRAQCTFVAFHHDGAFYLALPNDQVAPTLAALGKFALFSKVELAPCSDLLAVGLGTDGVTALPDDINAITIDVPHLGHMLFIAKEQAESFLSHLNQDPSAPKLCGDNAWHLSLINRGVAMIGQAQSEQWIPQEMNYDLINGVNFKKGCYKGQEIIARIHYRGQSKVRTHLLEIEGTTALQVHTGDKITAENTNGTILAVARVNERTLRVLSTLKITDLESENLKLEQNDGCQIRVLSLPYAIT